MPCGLRFLTARKHWSSGPRKRRQLRKPRTRRAPGRFRRFEAHSRGYSGRHDWAVRSRILAKESDRPMAKRTWFGTRPRAWATRTFSCREDGRIDDDHGPSFARSSRRRYHRPRRVSPYWHTPQDTLDKVSPRSLAIVGHVIRNRSRTSEQIPIGRSRHLPCAVCVAPETVCLLSVSCPTHGASHHSAGRYNLYCAAGALARASLLINGREITGIRPFIAGRWRRLGPPARVGTSPAQAAPSHPV